MKCNDDVRILQVLAALGTGFDCASKGEFKRILELGVSPSRIVYANSVKAEPHILQARSSGVDLMTFDNTLELHKVKELFPQAKLLLRIKANANVSLTKISNKFGCDATTEAPKLLKLAKELGLNIVGVTFFVGSGCAEPLVFRRAIEAARTLFDLGKVIGHDMKVLDVGGGLPGDKGTSIVEIASVINTALSDFFPCEDVEVIAEPGRYYAASCGVLATRIHSKKEVFKEGGTEVEHVLYYIDDGIHTSFNFTTLGSNPVRVPLPVKTHEGKLIESSVWGPTCNSGDQVNSDVLLPSMAIGDWLMYENMGAYSRVTACSFNGFSNSPAVHAIIDKSSWMSMRNKHPLRPDQFIVATPASYADQ